MPTPSIIMLMGLRASGKTTIGQRLATQLGRLFIDLDLLTAAQLGETTAGAALLRYGEKDFRLAEFDVLFNLLKPVFFPIVIDQPFVLALGGGTPTAPGAADFLRSARESGKVFIIYLATDEPTLTARLTADSTLRPSLTGRSTTDEVAALLIARNPLYRDLADLVIDAGSGTPAEIAERLHTQIPR